MTQKHSSERLFLIGMILSMTCWGFSWTAGKILSSYSEPLVISFLRFAVTFISLFFIVSFLKIPFRIALKGLADLFTAAALISLYTFLFFKGLTQGKAGAGGVLVTVLNPIIAYGIMLLMKKRRPTRNETVGLLLGLVAGVILLQLFSSASHLLDAGNIYFLLAALSWAVLSIFTSRSSQYGSPMTFSFWMYGLSTLMLAVFADLKESLEVLGKGDSIFWLNLIFSSTITTSLATTYYFYATSKLGASQASSFIFMVPFSAALGSWIFLSEVPQWHTLVGGALGIAAVYILNRK
jgi:drug/metabolite transporter (DMT)-like permease